jgi:hypothetical protein
MAQLKTKPTDQSVADFINSIDDVNKREDCWKILQIMQEACGETARMWGDSIVGLGSFHYKYTSGRDGDWFLTGFSPRKKDLTLYIMAGFEQYTQLLDVLGKYKTGKSCLYIKRVDDIDLGVLKELVERSVKHLRGVEV